ncbi:MAG: hypothetical protein AAGG81_05205, partial [Chlamydiota bacterium]
YTKPEISKLEKTGSFYFALTVNNKSFTLKPTCIKIIFYTNPSNKGIFKMIKNTTFLFLLLTSLFSLHANQIDLNDNEIDPIVFDELMDSDEVFQEIEITIRHPLSSKPDIIYLYDDQPVIDLFFKLLEYGYGNQENYRLIFVNSDRKLSQVTIYNTESLKYYGIQNGTYMIYAPNAGYIVEK